MIILVIILGMVFVRGVLGSSSSSIPDDLINQENLEIGIEEVGSYGNLLGFDNNDVVKLNNAVVRKMGDRVEVTLEKGGMIKFNREPESVYDKFDSESMDLNTRNKFVFGKGGVLVEAEFKTKSSDKVNKYEISGVIFSVPGSSSVIFKDGTAIIKPDKNPGYIIDAPIVSSYDIDPVKVNYVAPTDGVDIKMAISKSNFIIPLKSGEISFLHGDDYGIQLLGDKVVFENSNLVGDFSDATILSGIEIKNPTEQNTLLLLGDYENLDQTDRPYVNVVPIYSEGHNIVACAICVNDADGVEEGRIIGYDLSVSPGKIGDSPEITFSSGNPILPGMNKDQSVTINSGSSKFNLNTYFEFIETGEEARSSLTLYSKDAKIVNSGDTYIVKEENGKSDWYVERSKKGVDNYPIIMNLAQEKGSLIVYPAMINVRGEPITLIRKAYFEETRFNEIEIRDSNLEKRITLVSNIVGKLFGESARDKTESYLYDLFYPNSFAP